MIQSSCRNYLPVLYRKLPRYLDILEVNTDVIIGSEEMFHQTFQLGLSCVSIANKEHRLFHTRAVYVGNDHAIDLVAEIFHLRILVYQPGQVGIIHRSRCRAVMPLTGYLDGGQHFRGMWGSNAISAKRRMPFWKLMIPSSAFSSSCLT